jgi:WXG100 family type VII secretion target
MAAESAVSRAAMAQAAGQVEDAVSQIREQQSRLASQHSDLMAGWQGPAATAFTSAYEPFNRDFSQLLAAWQGIPEKLGTTRRASQSTECPHGPFITEACR